MFKNKDELAINMYLHKYYGTLYEFNDSTVLHLHQRETT